MLTEPQRAAAEALLAQRPPVLPGTRAIVNDSERSYWYAKVTAAMKAYNVLTAAEIDEFCNLAGVPD